MADVILYGQKGGKSTKDATATAADIRAGLTAYIASGKATGTLAVREATGSITLNANVTTTIQMAFTPVAAVMIRTDLVNRGLNALLVYNGNSYNVFDTAFQGYFESFGSAENALTITTKSYPDSAVYTWYAIGL